MHRTPHSAVLWVFVCLFAFAIGAQAEDFTIVALPDTQIYARQYPEIFYSQTNWIANNIQALNIKAVLGLGDIVDGGGSSTQWQVADRAYRALDGKVPYAAAIGNHDYNKGDSDIAGRTQMATNFNTYFGPSRYSGYAWYGGQYPAGSNENFFIRFSANGTKYLVVVLEFYPRDESIAWATQVIKANADSKVIVVTHSFLYGDSTRVDTCDQYSAEVYGLGGDNDGDEMWQNLVRRYPNIFMVLSGHVVVDKGIAHRADLGVNGNLVNQVLSDYQAYTNGGNGYLRILKFRPGLNRIEVSTYSPYLNQYLTDTRNQFVMEYKSTGTATGMGRVEGKVHDQSCNVLAGAKVKYSGGSTLTDQNGHYSLDIPGPSSTYVTASDSGKWKTQKAYLNPGYTESLDFLLQLDSTSSGGSTSSPPECSIDVGVKICSPADGANVSNAMELQAVANSPTGINNIQVWVDGSKEYQVAGGILDTTLTLSDGVHRVSVIGVDKNGSIYKQIIYVTASAGACSAPDTGIVVCSPANNATVSTEMPLSAAAHSATGINNIQVWVDGTKRYQVGGDTLNTTISLAPGTRRVSVIAVDTNGTIYKQIIYVTAQ